MALTNLLRITPNNFPFQHSTRTKITNITLQKFTGTVIKSSYYNWQNFTTSSKLIRSSFSEHHKVQTSTSSPEMDGEITRRRSIAVMMLLSVFLAASPASASSEADFIKKTISSHTIVIFSKSYCP